MSQGQILVLGAIAGLTIFLGLPAGRLQRLSTRAERAAQRHRDGHPALPPLGRAVGRDRAGRGRAQRRRARSRRHVGALRWPRHDLRRLLRVGLMSLVYFDQLIVKRRRKRASGASARLRSPSTRCAPRALSPAQSLSLMIATGIGLHNFSEGLAIGQSAASGRDQPRARARDRLRPPQRHRGLRHRRPVLGHRGAAELGLPAPRRA